MSTSTSDTLLTVSRTAQQDAPTLGHSVYGQGHEKVLVLHDWMGDAANYEPMFPYLEPNTYTCSLTCVAMDGLGI